MSLQLCVDYSNENRYHQAEVCHFKEPSRLINMSIKQCQDTCSINTLTMDQSDHLLNGYQQHGPDPGRSCLGWQVEGNLDPSVQNPGQVNTGNAASCDSSICNEGRHRIPGNPSVQNPGHQNAVNAASCDSSICNEGRHGIPGNPGTSPKKRDACAYGLMSNGKYSAGVRSLDSSKTCDYLNQSSLATAKSNILDEETGHFLNQCSQPSQNMSTDGCKACDYFSQSAPHFTQPTAFENEPQEGLLQEDANSFPQETYHDWSMGYYGNR